MFAISVFFSRLGCHFLHLHKGECQTDPYLEGCQVYKLLQNGVGHISHLIWFTWKSFTTNYSSKDIWFHSFYMARRHFLSSYCSECMLEKRNQRSDSWRGMEWRDFWCWKQMLLLQPDQTGVCLYLWNSSFFFKCCCLLTLLVFLLEPESVSPV